MTTARWTSAAFVAAGLAFLLFPLLRPWPDETVATTGLATAFASDRWVLAHLCGILGLGLLAPALLGLRAVLADDGGAGAGRGAGVGAATWALVTAWVGAGCAALYFGAEIFGIRTIAEAALRESDLGLLAEIEVLRLQPWAMTLFGAGLLLLAASGVLVAVALWRSGARPRWAGIPLAIGLVLVLPQFFGGPELRITHGFLVAAACTLIAATLRPHPLPTADSAAT
ncbi:hypothetical protein C8K30_11367 [Promicromonospora sp. AC04]|uniref:hypothetical protein n=1 Tax=Promicromonospora sp. AC04 TaxID=2135723 RepID=UPI000D3AE064|nr:hypothetical protein [Promicromonospora sp. AC04]PUB22199.1 hypothetical protein C8K30_11367 [Promicromonospora sp. AC04]